MRKALFFSAVSKYFLGVFLVALLLFLPAGTLRYWNGWLLMAVLFIPIFFAGCILMVKNPSLLKKRLDAKEPQKEQSKIVKYSGLMFLAGFICAGLNFRFSNFLLPRPLSIAASFLFLLSYLLYGEVLRENTYLSRTVEVQEGQQVISTGMYSIVRHPMYSATLVMFLSIPLILGSLLSFLIFLAYPMLIAARIRHEETLLVEELTGYRDYMTRVKYRLIPFLW